MKFNILTGGTRKTHHKLERLLEVSKQTFLLSKGISPMKDNFNNISPLICKLQGYWRDKMESQQFWHPGQEECRIQYSQENTGYNIAREDT